MNKGIAVSVKDLRKEFGEFIAVSDVSFQVKRGEIFGFLGANGAGKSTTIKMLSGILPPTKGDAIIAGYSVLKEPRKVRQSIGYMSQKFSLYEEMTVDENMRFFAKLYSVPKVRIEQLILKTYDMVGLIGYENQKAKDLSVGIKQRLSLGCAIIHKPKIIFLDEPTSGVDPVARRNFWNLIYDLSNNGVTIFVTTHYMDEAEYCDRIAMINAGTIQEIGTPLELKTSKMKKDVFIITGENLLDIYNILKNMTELFDVGLLSTSVRILSSNINIDTISKVLKNSGINIFNLSKVEASLEDVFVAFARR